MAIFLSQYASFCVVGICAQL